jgi:hypothetical protein
VIRNGNLGVVVSILLPVVVGGCASPTPLSPEGMDPYMLKLISAGHTGCQPEQNIISIVRPPGQGYAYGQWSATCNGRTFLCTSVITLTGQLLASCAIAVP